MAIDGDYEPSALKWVRDQVEEYEASGGTRANTLLDTGIPVIIVTMKGAASGKVRKIALMRVEHEGQYALVASYGGAPKHPAWYRNLMADPGAVQVQDGPAKPRVTSAPLGGTGRSPCSPTTPSTRRRPSARSRSSSPVPAERAGVRSAARRCA
jgi:deazaflavin-dependent oxidoreductase (nitroreductase family)